MNQQQIDELRELKAKATPGEWEATEPAKDDVYSWVVRQKTKEPIFGTSGRAKIADSTLVADLCNHADALLDAAERVIKLEAAMQGSGVSLIAYERYRHICVEGWTPEHDDRHVDGEMAMAAACYAADHWPWGAADPWPWDAKWDKRGKHDRIRQLVIAGSLIAAEIDRLQRAALADGGGKNGH